MRQSPAHRSRRTRTTHHLRGWGRDGLRPVKTILGVLGKSSFYMGPSGSGAMMKLCANTLLGLGMQALAETLTLGLKAGLPRERLVEVLGIPRSFHRARNPNSRTY